jgi:hypothetical protein
MRSLVAVLILLACPAAADESVAPQASGEPVAAEGLDTERAALDRALEAYTAALEEGDRDARLAGFARAERLFSNVVESGAHNAALLTNVGNAALQAEHRGSAVLAYRRALALDADFPRALQNLEHVRTLLPGWVPRPEPAGMLDSFFVHRTFPRADRILAGSAAFAVGGMLIGLSIRTRQGLLRAAGVVALLLWALLVGSIWLDGGGEDRRAAVITAEEVAARSADSALAPLALPEPLPGGTEVSLIERRPPWARIRLANGRDAWVNASSVTRILPDSDFGRATGGAD